MTNRRWTSWLQIAAVAGAGFCAGMVLLLRNDVSASLAPAVLSILLIVAAVVLRARMPSLLTQQMQHDLQLNERRYRSLVQATSAIVWRTSPTGEFVSPQPEWSRFTGLSHDEIKGWGRLKAVHPDDRARVTAAWQVALSKHTLYQSEHRMKAADGAYHVMSARGVPILGPEGEILEWVGAHIDITGQRRAEREVAESEHHLQRVLNSLFTFVGVLTPQGSLLSTNEAPLKAANISLEEVIGKPFWECHWWRWSPVVQGRIRDAILSSARGEPLRFDIVAQMAGSSLMHLDFMLAPMRNETGQITHLIASAVDISDRKRAENALAEREQFYRHLIEGMPMLVWTMRPDGQCDYISSKWREFAGDSPPKGFSDLEYVHPDDRPAVEQAWNDSQQTGRSYYCEMRVRRKDGEYRWFANYAAPWRDSDGRIIKWGGTSIEIHDRKQMEEALRDSEVRLRTINSTLEERVRERTAEVEARSEQLRAMAMDLAETESRERKRLAQMLHDHFQQLVSAAKLKAGLLRRRIGPGEYTDSLNQIESLLNEAISASRSLATQLSPPVLHDAGLAAGLHWLARRMGQDHHVQVKLDVQGDCEPDNEQVRDLLFECIRELLFNVRKHAGVDQAEVCLRAVPEGLLQVQVIDHGKGFAPVSLERRKKNDAKFGLLSIRERLGLIGGLMTVDSRPGHGTRVQISVPSVKKPVAPAEPVFTTKPPPDLAGPSPLRVLVADDHSLFREGLVTLISQEPYAQLVGQAADGMQAIEMAQQLRPDVMIVDVSMPKLNGVQVTAAVIRAMPHVRIIGLSMHEQEDMAKAMRDAGAVAYCPKSGPAEETIMGFLRQCARELAKSHQPAAATAT